MGFSNSNNTKVGRIVKIFRRLPTVGLDESSEFIKDTQNG